MCGVPTPRPLREVKPRHGLEATPLDWTSGDRDWLCWPRYASGSSCALGLRKLGVCLS